jgi:hypothetical protein
MTKFRSFAIIAVVGALFTGKAFAADAGSGDGGEWNTKYGMIFTVQNVFQNGNASTLADLGGSVGLQYNLAPQRALRLTVDLSRASHSGATTETTNLATGITTKTFTPPVGYSSRYGVGLGVDYMVRLTDSALAPYLGAGGRISYGQTALAYKDDITSQVATHEVDNMNRTIGLGAEGILGVEWRVHKSVSLFAEYALNLGLIDYTSTNNKDQTTVNATGAVSGTKTKYSTTTYFNWNTGLAQGGIIGLVAFF